MGSTKRGNANYNGESALPAGSSTLSSVAKRAVNQSGPCASYGMKKRSGGRSTKEKKEEGEENSMKLTGPMTEKH